MALDFMAALEGARSAFGLIQVAVAARDDSKIQAALLDMSTRLLDATLAANEAATKLSLAHIEQDDLRRQLSDLRQRVEQRGSYELAEVGKLSYALAFKARDGDVTPPHYACQVCMDAGQLTVLKAGWAHPRGPLWVCSRDRAHNVLRSES